MEEVKEKRLSVRVSGDVILCNQMVEAINLVQWVVNQGDLRSYILNFTNRFGEKCFLQTRRTNLWHLEAFESGNERGSGRDRIWNIEIRYFDGSSGISAYTIPGDRKVWVNRTLLDGEVSDVCSTLVHEYCHLVGMTHSLLDERGEWMQSAPYAIGAYAGYLIRRKLGLPANIPQIPEASAFQKWRRRIRRSLGTHAH